MLLVLYMEYQQRCRGLSYMLSYSQWLDSIRLTALEEDLSFGDMVREGIDPTYKGD